MSGSHNVNLKPDSLEGKHIDPVGFLASQKTPEDKRKVKSVDIQLDVLKNELEEPDTTSNVRCEVTEDEDRKNLEDKKVVDSAQNNQPQENKESSKYFDHAQSSSTKKSIPTCPCEESVENYLNVRDSTEEPIVDKEKKNEAVNVRENTEEPLVDKEKKDQATQGVDSTSVRSNSVSETSRHTDSSENDFVGTKCEDAQVTLPYTAVNVRENTEEPLDDKEKKNKAVNVRENTEEPLDDKEKKNKTVNVRENTEGPLVDKKKKDQATPGVDSTSVRSNSVSETSRHTDSSENDFVGTKCEDAQVTLPYKAVNVRKSTEEPLVDKEKKNKAVNVRENTEEPLVDKEKKDQATPGVDSTSVRSKRVSDTSRHTDSSENDYVGTKCEDAQVTLPYPDKNGPPECIAKLRNAGLYDPSKERTELDVVKNELKEPDATSNVRCEITDEDRKDLEDKKKDVDSVQNNQPPENKETSNYDQGQPSSQKLCKIKSNPTCLCKECVENCLNVRVNTEGPLVDKEKKNKAVNVRENTEGPLVDKEKKDEATPGVDRTSVRNRRVSDTSRHTDSSENDYVGTKCEDAQVTLPYPDKKGPPECIARLSNAGLYDPSEERTGKTGNKDKISQVAINTSVFVKQPALEKQKNVQKDECDVVDIEKGDTERDTLICHTRTSVDQESVYPGFCQCHKACLKLVGSFVLSMLIFPAFLFAAYAWLPFDAPLIPDVPTRLVYTLRCSTFASFPIVLGVIVHGISRLCASSYNPFKPREREVTIHRRFVKQSTFLFVLYFFNLSVLATYLPQKHLKFIPLLTCLFSLSQLIYWLSFAVGRSFRGFGYGLTFLPLVSMLMCNLYFMFVIEPEKMLFLGSRVVPQN